MTSKSTNGNPPVAEYVVQRLAALGIKYAFGVPGDFAFPIDKAIEKCEGLTWIGCSNELNAAYAADGYARVYGAAILSTTYNVGSAAALAGVMGCKAERVPVFHVVGAPSKRLARTRRHMHHSYADGNLDQFHPYHEVSVCASAYLTPQNTITEMERVIFEALSQRMPVYIQIAEDYALMPVIGVPIPGVPLAEAPAFSSNTRGIAGRFGGDYGPASVCKISLDSCCLHDRALWTSKGTGNASGCYPNSLCNNRHEQGIAVGIE